MQHTYLSLWSLVASSSGEKGLFVEIDVVLSNQGSFVLSLSQTRLQRFRLAKRLGGCGRSFVYPQSPYRAHPENHRHDLQST
jgi:hypothetical protein